LRRRKVLENYRNSDFNLTYSIVNMKLRDEYSSLQDLLRAFDIDEEDFMKYLAEHGCRYDSVTNSIKTDE
jgi:hypothetical protein